MYQESLGNHETSSADDSSSQQTPFITSLGQANSISGKLLMLMPPTLHAFDLQSHKWRELRVSDISSVYWDDSLSDLALNDKKKSLLISSMKPFHSRRYREGDEQDLPTSVIIHCYGGPETDKAFAAEAIAEYTRRPLYQLNAADFGTTAKQAEVAINEAMMFAASWQCVLLLDDVGLYLEPNSERDMGRNALASAMMRLMDNFNGILVMTTDIDRMSVAFKSRIHLTLPFSPLKSHHQGRLWEKFLEPIMVWDEYEPPRRKLEKYPFNCHSIRTVVTAAKRLADARGKPLDYGDIEEVMKVHNLT